MPDIEVDVNSFLKQTLVAVLGTTNEAGNPHLTPIWYTKLEHSL